MSAPIRLAKMSTFRNNFRLLRCIYRQSNECKSCHSFYPTCLFNRQQSTSVFSACLDKTDFQISDRRFCTGHTHSHGDDRKCWNCGTELEKEKERFFCNCGVVQYIPTEITFFDLMECGESFDIDVEAMSKLYRDLQSLYHPDKFSQKSEDEQTIALSQSSYINKAYNTLLKPLSRGLYLLELRGDPLEETNSSVDPQFLMEIMEVNEDLAEAEGTESAVKELEMINNKRIAKCVKNISTFFSEGNVAKAKTSLIKLKYFTNIEDKIKEIYRKQM